MFHEKFDNLDRKMDFYLTTRASTFPCFQIKLELAESCKK